MDKLIKDRKFQLKVRHLAQNNILRVAVWDDAGVAEAWLQAVNTALVEAGYEIVPKTPTKADVTTLDGSASATSPIGRKEEKK